MNHIPHAQSNFSISKLAFSLFIALLILLFTSVSITYADATSNTGVIGGIIWSDTDNSGGDIGSRGVEPGIANVEIQMLDSVGNLYVTTTNDEGLYLFGGLALDREYTVSISPENLLPSGVLEGSANTYDSDQDMDHSGTILTLSAAAPQDNAQDFSYHTALSIINDGNNAPLVPTAVGMDGMEIGRNTSSLLTIFLLALAGFTWFTWHKQPI